MHIAIMMCLCVTEELMSKRKEDSADETQARTVTTEQATFNNVVFPMQEWLRADAEKSKFDPEMLNLITAKMKEAKANGVLVRDGRLIAEWTFDGLPTKRFDIQSCTKTITSCAVGIAIREGRIPSVDTPVKQCWPDFEAGPFTDRITFRHLLTMTAGIVQTTCYGTSQDKFLPTEYAEPGTRYNYLNDQSKALATALTYIYGRELGDFMNEKLKPLGATMKWGSEPGWDPDVVTADGKRIRVNCGYSRAHFSASNLARVGHLYLQKGAWAGERILSEEFVEQSLTANPVAASKRQEVGEDGLILTGGYGFKWRQHEVDSITTWGMHGYGCQFCVIVPEYNVVMTKLSDWRDKNTWIDNTTFYPLLIRSLKRPIVTQ